MSYSGLAKGLLLSVALSACAHTAPTQSAANTFPASNASADARDTNAPRFQRLHAAFLAGEAHPYETTGGDVFVEHRDCEVWGNDASKQCDLESLANESMAPGTVSTRW